jgi:hypothetical protein
LASEGCEIEDDIIFSKACIPRVGGDLGQLATEENYTAKPELALTRESWILSPALPVSRESLELSEFAESRR